MALAMESAKRIHLLSRTEVEELYARPEFNIREQHLYLTLTKSEHKALAKFSNAKTRVYFILQLGYFKAKQQFYNFSLDEVSSDVQFIVSTYYSDSASPLLTGRISRDYVRIQRQIILSLYAYRNWTSDLVPEIQAHIGDLLRYYPKGHNAFRQVLSYFDHQKIVIPAYTTIQDIFSQAFADEEKRLSTLIASIPASFSDQLATLIHREEGITALNIIRADQKDFQYTAVKTEVNKAQRIEGLYIFAKAFIPSLNLSKNAVRYLLCWHHRAVCSIPLTETQQATAGASHALLCLSPLSTTHGQPDRQLLLPHARDYGWGQNLCLDGAHGAQHSGDYGFPQAGPLPEMVSLRRWCINRLWDGQNG